jgi:cbb3-type cytochrome c oxidase subunit III
MRSLKLSMFVIAVSSIAIANVVEAADDYPVAAEEFVYCTVCHGAQLMGNSTIRAPRLSKMETWYVERQLTSFKNGWRGKHAADAIGMEMQPMAAALSDEQIAAVAQFVSATTSPSQSITVQGNASRGRTHYANCSACHGENGKGNQALGGPDLTGTNDWYLLEQLQKFRDGRRGSHPKDTFGGQMRAAVQILHDDDAVQDVVSYINTL